MPMRKAPWLTAGLLVVVLVGTDLSRSVAQVEPKAEPPKPGAPLTPETLEDFLKRSLEEPQAVGKEGLLKYRFWLKRDRLVKTASGEKTRTIWTQTYLDLENTRLRVRAGFDIPAVATFPPNVVAGLLERGAKTPGAFATIEDNVLWISLLLDNRGLTERLFAQELNKFYDALVNNFELLDFASAWLPREKGRMFHGGYQVRGVAFTPDSQRVLTADTAGKIRLFELATMTLLATMEASKDGVFGLLISTDGKKAWSGEKRGVLRQWDLDARKELKRFEGHKHTVWALAQTRDGKLLASAGGAFRNASGSLVDADGKPPADPDFAIRLWDAESGKELKKLDGHTLFVKSVAFSPDGKRLASTGEDGTIRIWDVETGKELKKFDGHKTGTERIAFLPDGKRILTGAIDNSLRLWDAETGKELRKFLGHTSSVWGMGLSPDGKLALSSSPDKTIRFWDVETGQPVVLYHSAGEGQAIQVIPLFGGHTNYIITVVVSPDGKRAVSGGFDGVARVWDITR